MASKDSDQRTNEKVALDHAGQFSWNSSICNADHIDQSKLSHVESLLQYASLDLPTEVFLYLHNNALTMISSAAAIIIQVSQIPLRVNQLRRRVQSHRQSQASNSSLAFYTNTILERLRDSIKHSPHADSIKRWHVSFFEKALEKIVTPGTLDVDVLQMLNETIPGDLMDMIAWDMPSDMQEWQNPS